jgi:hypothetical protein
MEKVDYKALLKRILSDTSIGAVIGVEYQLKSEIKQINDLYHIRIRIESSNGFYTDHAEGRDEIEAGLIEQQLCAYALCLFFGIGINEGFKNRLSK